jgi:hypothetical protein
LFVGGFDLRILAVLALLLSFEFPGLLFLILDAWWVGNLLNLFFFREHEPAVYERVLQES